MANYKAWGKPFSMVVVLSELKIAYLNEKQSTCSPALITEFGDTRERFSRTTINKARGLHKEGKFLEVNELLLLKTNPLEGIMRSSAQVSTMSEQISDAARQQGVASEEVATSMQQITDLIERNSASANSAKQAAAELLVTSRQLDTLIAGFELYRK